VLVTGNLALRTITKGIVSFANGRFRPEAVAGPPIGQSPRSTSSSAHGTGKVAPLAVIQPTRLPPPKADIDVCALQTVLSTALTEISTFRGEFYA
jgi:hypothetical protein